MAKQKIDRLQQVTCAVVQSVAGTSVAAQFTTNISSAEPKGIMIRRIQYDFRSQYSALAGLSAMGQLSLIQIQTNIPSAGQNTSLAIAPAGVLDWCHMSTRAATPAGGDAAPVFSVVHEFGEGDLIAHPSALFAAASSINEDAVFGGSISIWFRYIDLSPEDYNEILQSFILHNTL